MELAHTPVRPGRRGLVVVSCAVWLLAGCSGFSAVVNTNAHLPMPAAGTFTLHRESGDAVVGSKIERVLRRALELRGYRHVDASPELFVSYRMAVLGAGARTTVEPTTVIPAPVVITNSTTRSTTVVGSPVVVAGTGVRETRRLYTKRISVQVSAGAERRKLWDGLVEQTDMCSQLFVVAPEMMVALFDGFPQERTNVELSVESRDTRVAELRRAFPDGTNWRCSGG